MTRKEYRRRVRRTELEDAFANGIHRRDLRAVQKRLVSMREVQQVIDFLLRLDVWNAVKEIQGAHTGLNIVWCRDADRNFGRHLHLGDLLRRRCTGGNNN